MRRLSSLLILFVLASGITTFSTETVKAATAAGVSTTVTATPPAAVTGLAIAGVGSARDGGMYYAYQNATGDNYSLVKQKSDKTFDTTFGTSGVAVIPGATVPVSGGSRRTSIVSDLNNKWWTISSTSGATGNLIAVSSGAATGQPTAQATFTATTLAGACAAALPAYRPSSWLIGSAGLTVKRTSGVWMTFGCTGNASAPLNSTVLVALKNDLTIDTAISSIAINETQGSSVQCHTSALVSDPTGPSTSPELWVLRLEHTKLDSLGLCSFPSAAPDVSGYDILRISSTGVVSRTAIASAGDAFDARFSIRLDAGGRPLLVGASYADPSKVILARLKTDGTLDTTIFPSGFTSLPIGATPAGATSVNAGIMGIITSAENVYISVLLTDQPKTSYSCGSTTSTTFGYRTAVLSYSKGYAATYGTSGVSDRVTVTFPEKTICTFLSGGSSVTNAGNPRIAYTNGTELFYSEWQRPSDATGGSEGGTGTGGYTKDTGGAPSSGESKGAGPAGRVDKKVYSTKLPAAAQADSALTVLTAKQAEDLDIRTNTPKICIALTTSVVMVNPGRCVIRIIDEDTKKVIRTMTTIVKKSEVEEGTTLTTDEPIYFRQASVRLSKNALAQVAELAEAAKDASRVVVIGHSAALGDVSQYSFAISRNRADAVRAALIKAGVKAPIEIVAMSYSQPEKTAKTEKAQALNRRAEVYIFPK